MRTKATRVIDMILLLTAVAVMGSCSLYLLNKYTPEKPRPMVAHAPAFKAGECFVRNGIREVWEPEADGKVIYVGVLQYVLMGHEEAERRHGGDKSGFPQSIESFDLNHHKVLCPLSWKQKGITK